MALSNWLPKVFEKLFCHGEKEMSIDIETEIFINDSFGKIQLI